MQRIRIVFNIAYGDVNGDAEITADDALEILKAVVRLKILNEDQIMAADVTEDNQITADDALVVLKRVVRLIDHFPVES